MENKGPRILIIDDETQIRRFLRVALTDHGYKRTRKNDGMAAARGPVYSGRNRASN